MLHECLIIVSVNCIWDMASMLYMEGLDSVSISARLGHAQVSTTANIYAHALPKRDKDNSDALEKLFLKNENPDSSG